MKCEVCGMKITDGEAMEICGKRVCEDCYIDASAKPKACDPWAVYSAKNMTSGPQQLNVQQAAILSYLEKNGPAPPEKLTADLGLSMDDFEREMAVLRHMEKVRARLNGGRKEICLW
ncbi:MAG: hypothetical protein SWC96_02420 [Thermodesulfobacteriota bacterium]|nr:hypothetical protein [Thermodesulfobacteriota bacterium]